MRSRGRLIPFLKPYWKTEEIEVGRAWLAGGQPANGIQSVEDFENEFQNHTGLRGLAVATSSGRTAMFLALKALKFENPHRDQVIIPSYSCGGLLTPIVENGLAPVFADIGHDLNLTQSTVAPHLSKKTLALVLVHLGGKYASEIEVITTEAEQAGAIVIEDLCHGLGGRFGDTPWGSASSMAFFSFGLGKNLTATAGGVLIARTATETISKFKRDLGTENTTSAVARFSQMLKTFFEEPPTRSSMVAYSSKDPFQSAYGFNRISLLDAQLMSYQLRRMKEIIGARQRNAETMLAAIGKTPRLHVPGESGPNVWTKFTVIADTLAGAKNLRKTFHRAGIETETMYTPLHLRIASREYAAGSLAVTESIYPRTFNLPVRPSIEEAQMDYAAKIVRHALAH